jgi:hypothetical protein
VINFAIAQDQLFEAAEPQFKTIISLPAYMILSASMGYFSRNDSAGGRGKPGTSK